jgi:hypothetical protein
VLFLFCSEEEEDIVARVGNEVLTIDNLKSSIPYHNDNQIKRDQNIDYVKQWINRELLYQEAIRRKIDRDPVIKERMEKMKKDLLASELLSRISDISQNGTFDDSSITNYYNVNVHNFIREKDLVKLIILKFDSSQQAWETYRTLTLQNIIRIASTNSANKTFDSSNIPYIPIESLSGETRTAVISTSTKAISLPFKTSTGYQIICPLEKLSKGEPCTLNEIRSEIINQLTTLQQKKLIDQLLVDLRLKNEVNFNKNLISNTNGGSAE